MVTQAEKPLFSSEHCLDTSFPTRASASHSDESIEYLAISYARIADLVRVLEHLNWSFDPGPRRLAAEATASSRKRHEKAERNLTVGTLPNRVRYVSASFSSRAVLSGGRVFRRLMFHFRIDFRAQ